MTTSSQNQKKETDLGILIAKANQELKNRGSYLDKPLKDGEMQVVFQRKPVNPSAKALLLPWSISAEEALKLVKKHLGIGGKK